MAAAPTGKVVSVSGPIAPAELGVCLPHEHLICALDGPLDWPRTDARAAAFADEPLTAANLDRVRRDPFGNRANLRLDDFDEMVAELALYAAAGGRAVVDQTPDELGRDPAALARLARATGLHVVAGCGHYVADLLSLRTAAATVDELAAELLAELLPGTGRGGPPCGLIGEIGVSSQGMAPVELRVLRAVARAQRSTGAPVSLHSVAPGHGGLEALLVLKEHGVDPGRVAVCHLDSDVDDDSGHADESGRAAAGDCPEPGIDLDYCREIAREGAFIEFDGFGWPAPRAQRSGRAADLSRADHERVAAVAALCAEGLAGSILVSHDIAMKIRLTSHGGCGYAHLGSAVTAHLAGYGVDAATCAASWSTTPRAGLPGARRAPRPPIDFVARLVPPIGFAVAGSGRRDSVARQARRSVGGEQDGRAWRRREPGGRPAEDAVVGVEPRHDAAGGRAVEQHAVARSGTHAHARVRRHGRVRAGAAAVEEPDVGPRVSVDRVRRAGGVEDRAEACGQPPGRLRRGRDSRVPGRRASAWTAGRCAGSAG